MTDYIRLHDDDVSFVATNEITDECLVACALWLACGRIEARSNEYTKTERNSLFAATAQPVVPEQDIEKLDNM